MKIIAFIEWHQTDVIQKILSSCGRGMGCGKTPRSAARRRRQCRLGVETKAREDLVGRIALRRCVLGRPAQPLPRIEGALALSSRGPGRGG